MPARVTLRLDFDADRRLGHGKVSLLEAIRRSGSISAAGRDVGMSYRRAWTALGEEVVRLYRDVERTVSKGARAAIERMEGALAALEKDPA